MKKATNYMRGTLRLEVVGPYPERFINICSARSISFWRVERVDETTLRLDMPLSRGKAAQKLGEKCLCEVTVVEQRGAPALLGLLRRRWGMMTGCLLSVLAVLVLSRFVLVVEITGETNLPEGVLLAALEEAGLYPGVYGPGVDEREISNRMLLAVEELGFLTVNLHGVRAEVVVRDALPKPELEPTDLRRDMVASKAGRILDVQGLAGEVLVEEGDWVSPGEMLISGGITVTNADGSAVLSTYEVYAKGEVWAQVEECFSASTPLNCYGKRHTGETVREFEAVILGKSYKISPKAFQPFTYYDKIEVIHEITVGNQLTLPFALICRQAEEYELTVLTLDPNSAEAHLRRVLEERLTQAVGEEGSILSREWSVKRDKDVLTVTVTAQCREQIALGVTEE